jgi:predicted permease
MLQIVAPIFAVILVGFIVGKRHSFGGEAEKLFNDYVLYIALPALLFLAVARADPVDLAHWQFMTASLAGIAAAYLAGVAFGRMRGTGSPGSSLIGMASCYGTTGYMGIPMLVAALGPQAAVPAAIATVVHNIPVILTVIVTHDAARQEQSRILVHIGRALATTLKNPLTIAVLAGAAFSILTLPLPVMITRFAEFLGSAAGPTALFALGLGLARIPISSRQLSAKISWVAPVVTFKTVLQPLVTFVVFVALGGRQDDLWFAAAIIMAAQPIGAGAYVFAKRYEHFDEETSLGIVVSLVFTIATLSLLLGLWRG